MGEAKASFLHTLSFTLIHFTELLLAIETRCISSLNHVLARWSGNEQLANAKPWSRQQSPESTPVISALQLQQPFRFFNPNFLDRFVPLITLSLCLKVIRHGIRHLGPCPPRGSTRATFRESLNLITNPTTTKKEWSLWRTPTLVSALLRVSTILRRRLLMCRVLMCAIQ